MDYCVALPCNYVNKPVALLSIHLNHIYWYYMCYTVFMASVVMYVRCIGILGA